MLGPSSRPFAKPRAAGVSLQVHNAVAVTAGEPLFTVHAESRGELDYAMEYAAANTDIVQLVAR